MRYCANNVHHLVLFMLADSSDCTSKHSFVVFYICIEQWPTTFVLIVSIYISFSSISYCQDSTLVESVKSATAYMSYANVKINVVIYESTVGGKLDVDDVVRLVNSLDLVREFFWRNSRCQLNLQYTYQEITKHKSKFYSRDAIKVRYEFTSK